jgi:hypothetical protein
VHGRPVLLALLRSTRVAGVASGSVGGLVGALLVLQLGDLGLEGLALLVELDDLGARRADLLRLVVRGVARLGVARRPDRGDQVGVGLPLRQQRLQRGPLLGDQVVDRQHLHAEAAEQSLVAAHGLLDLCLDLGHRRPAERARGHLRERDLRHVELLRLVV